jgi:hypothetical protein
LNLTTMSIARARETSGPVRATQPLATRGIAQASNPAASGAQSMI